MSRATVLSVVLVSAFVVVPLGLLAWLALARPKSRIGLGLHALMVAGFLGFFQAAGAGWSIVGVWIPWALWALFAVALASALRRARGAVLAPVGLSAWAAAVGNGGVGAVFLAGLVLVTRARTFEPAPIALDFPLRGGTFHVSHGGSEAAMNHHHQVFAQRYALDVVGLNALGARASGLFPGDLSSYVIYGAEVHAPCDGVVLWAEDGHPDQPPLGRDAESLVGNAVILACADSSVLLAHLRQGSVAVAVGARVARGDRLGVVGNSGNTSEPHLHLHAVRGHVATLQAIVTTAEPVPMTFDGRFPVRNDRIHR